LLKQVKDTKNLQDDCGRQEVGGSVAKKYFYHGKTYMKRMREKDIWMDIKK
jgi:hypothetical protein